MIYKFSVMVFASFSLLVSHVCLADDFMKGKELVGEQCLSCHDANLDPPVAPPLFGVQNNYMRFAGDKEAFVAKMTAFTMDPKAEGALMTKAVEAMGVMPHLDFVEAEVRLMAAYIYDEHFAPPCNHWLAGMKIAMAKGDMVHYKQDKKRYQNMCE